MKLNLSGINLEQFLKNNPQFSKKTETVILTDGKNEIEVNFSQTQEKNISVPPTKIVKKTQQEKVNEALKLHGLWLQNKKGGKQISPENYPKDFFKGMNLRIADLRSADLQGVDLYDANLCGANLTHANLKGVNLKDVYLKNVNLCGANLSGANLKDVYLYGANLTGSILIGSNLSSANLYDANLSNANLYDANLSNANLSNANLSNANLICANLTNCIINKYTKGISFELIKNLK